MRGGLSTKIHAAVDALGNPVRFLLTQSQASEYMQAKELIADFSADYVIADKGYDSDDFVAEIEAGGGQAVIPHTAIQELANCLHVPGLKIICKRNTFPSKKIPPITGFVSASARRKGI